MTSMTDTTSRPSYDRCTTALSYQYPVDYLIRQFKFHNNLACGRLLAQLLIEKCCNLSNAKPDCLIPVPLHINRLRERGFNQAALLAQQLGNALDIPLDRKSCQRIYHTPAQSRLPAKQRQSNLKGAFATTRDFNNLHVAIVDDVMTSGHTAGALAQLLRRNGAATVDVWVCARTG